MPQPGRGRGDSKKIQAIDRQSQPEARASSGLSESETPIRGRGGFRQAELRTIPTNVSEIRNRNLANVKQVDLVTNYVRILPMKGRIVHRYRVDYEPQVESVTLMRTLFSKAARTAFTDRPIFDGVNECRSGQKLQEDVTKVKVQLEEPNASAYEVILTYTGTATFGAEMLRTYNTHMRTFLQRMGFYQPQPGLYVNPGHSTQVGRDIMMLRGYQTSANNHDENNMLMNLNAAHKLIQRNNVLQIMTEIRNRAGGANLQEVLRSELVGKLVVTSYKKVCYRIEDIDFNSNPDSTFDRNGTQISFAQYFRDVYQCEVRDKNQPLLLAVLNKNRRREEEAGDRREQALIPELCNIAGLTDQQRNDNRLKFDLIKASQISPNDRVDHLKQFLHDFHNNQNIKAQLLAWGYGYDTEPMTLKAHVLPPTRIGQAGAHQRQVTDWLQSDQNTADFSVNSLAVSPPIPKMAILVPGRLPPEVKKQCLDVLRGGFERVRLTPQPPRVIDLNGDNPSSYIEAIRQLPQDVTIAIVIMINQNKERYDSIKKAATVERGFITQVVTSKLLTDSRKAGGAAQKIAVQIAAKVGGEPWWVDIPPMNVMVCGYDTYHDTTQRGRSHGAFLASMNAKFSKWYSKADAHDRLDEMSAQVSNNLQEALNNYKKLNGKFPDRVVVYRDGVGVGQIEHVFKVELEKIKGVVKNCSSSTSLTMVLVNKRIGARFYMKAAGGFTNPTPGTVVDHGVTRQERFDFYLISQSTRHGTVTPTYYNIIFDESGWTPDIHQKMAYKMCLLYYNWSGSVRVPAPCQYAHKLALLCGENLHAQPNANLDNRLHFL